MTRLTKQKIILSGDILEAYLYEKDLMYGFRGKSGTSALVKKKTEDEKKEIMRRSLSQTKNRLIRIINANAHQWFDGYDRPFSPKFLTFTFAENLTDLTEANRLYTNFLKNFNYRMEGTRKSHFKYVCVPEFQKRGAVHFHAIVFNLLWIDKDLLAEIWDHGFIKIKQVSQVPNLGAYMTKYMTKDALDERLHGRKRYFASRNLNRPLEVLDEPRIGKILQLVSTLPKWEKEYKSKYQGQTKRSVVDLSEFPEVKEAVIGLL